MSISALSSNSAVSQGSAQTGVSQMEQLFKQLANSLQSGNLSNAQKTYASINTLLQKTPANGQSSGTQAASAGAASSASESPVQNDFEALGQALASGNLGQAQMDFSKMQSDAKAASQNSGSGSTGKAHHGHHHHRQVAETSSSSSADATSSSSSSAGTASGTSSSASSTGNSSAAASNNSTQTVTSGGRSESAPQDGVPGPASTGSILNVYA